MPRDGAWCFGRTGAQAARFLHGRLSLLLVLDGMHARSACLQRVRAWSIEVMTLLELAWETPKMVFKQVVIRRIGAN
jgi:hypothetical protein